MVIYVRGRYQFVELFESIGVIFDVVFFLVVLDVEPSEIVKKSFFQLNFLRWMIVDQGTHTSSVLRPLRYN